MYLDDTEGRVGLEGAGKGLTSLRKSKYGIREFGGEDTHVKSACAGERGIWYDSIL